MLIPKSCLLLSFFKTMGKNDCMKKHAVHTMSQNFHTNSCLFHIQISLHKLFSLKSTFDYILNKCKQIGIHDKIL